MARLQPSVVPMSRADVAQVAELWVDRRVEAGQSRDVAQRVVAEGQFLDATTRPHVLILTAVVEGELVGYAWVTTHALTAQMDVPSVAIDDIYVVAHRRGQGVGRALLVAVAAYAGKRGVDLVGFTAPAGDKDAGRTLTRLGFATATTRRVAPASVLLRRLRGPEARGTIDQLLLQRRRRAQLGRPASSALAAGS